MYDEIHGFGIMNHDLCIPVLVVLDHVLQRGRPVDAPLELGCVQHRDLVLKLLYQEVNNYVSS